MGRSVCLPIRFLLPWFDFKTALIARLVCRSWKNQISVSIEKTKLLQLGAPPQQIKPKRLLFHHLSRFCSKNFPRYLHPLRVNSSPVFEHTSLEELHSRPIKKPVDALFLCIPTDYDWVSDVLLAVPTGIMITEYVRLSAHYSKHRHCVDYQSFGLDRDCVARPFSDHPAMVTATHYYYRFWCGSRSVGMINLLKNYDIELFCDAIKWKEFGVHLVAVMHRFRADHKQKVEEGPVWFSDGLDNIGLANGDYVVELWHHRSLPDSEIFGDPGGYWDYRGYKHKHFLKSEK